MHTSGAHRAALALLLSWCAVPIAHTRLAAGDPVLVVEVAADPTSGPAVLTVSFSARASGGVGDGYIYFWDFDASDGIQRDAIGKAVTYPFGTPGTSAVTVRAWDHDGNWGVGTMTIDVETPVLTSPEAEIVEIRDASFPEEEPHILEGMDFEGKNLIVSNARNVVIRRNRFRNTERIHGGIILVEYSKGITIEENIFEDNLEGLSVNHCEDVRIRSNVIRRIGYRSQTAGSGIIITGTDRMVVEGNLIEKIGPTFDARPPGYDVPSEYLDYIGAGIGAWGVSDYTVRGNFVFDVYGVNIIVQTTPDTLLDVPTQLTLEGNFIRNQWIREAGIMLADYPDIKIQRNLIDYSSNFGIVLGDCENVDIGDNIILRCVGGGIFAFDSRKMKIYHNTLFRRLIEGQLPYSSLGEGIWILEERDEPYTGEGVPFPSTDLVIVDNLIDGWYDSGILLGAGERSYLDHNVIAEVDLDEHNNNIYTVIMDSTETVTIGENNRIATPHYISPDDGNFFLLRSDALSTGGHDGRAVGALWNDTYVFDMDPSDITPLPTGENRIANGGAESGETAPWNIAYVHNIADTLFEVRSEATIDGRTVSPQDGSRFFLFGGRAQEEGEGHFTVHQSIPSFEIPPEEIDSGRSFFKATVHVLSSDIRTDFGIEIRVELLGDEGSYSVASSKSKVYRISPGEYSQYSLYGQMPPGSREAFFNIHAYFFHSRPEFAVAFDDVRFEILAPPSPPTSVDSGSSKESSRAFALYPNHPNPFNASTAMAYHISRPTHVRLTIHNALGQAVETLVNHFQTPGHHSVVWNPQEVGSGLYFYRFQAGAFTDVRKCLLLK